MPNSPPLDVGGDRGEVSCDRRFRPRFATSQVRAVAALVIVSSVVKVFDATMNSVCRIEIVRRLVEVAPSTLETKRNVIARSLNGSSARYAISGPRYEPPMPIFTTLRMRLPVWPVNSRRAGAW